MSESKAMECQSISLKSNDPESLTMAALPGMEGSIEQCKRIVDMLRDVSRNSEIRLKENENHV